MTKNNKIVAGLISLLVLVSVSFEARKFFITKDYFVYLNAPCEVGGKFACFVYEDEEAGVPGEPYLKTYRKAFEVQSCLDSGSCDPYVCRPDEEGCFLITCDNEAVEEGESCITGPKYEEIE